MMVRLPTLLIVGFHIVARDASGTSQDLSKLAARVDAVIESPPKLFRYLSKGHLGGEREREGSREYWQLESQLWKILPRNVWTENPEDADFFVFEHTFFGHWDRRQVNQKSYLMNNMRKRLLDLRDRYPYYNRSSGRYENQLEPNCPLNLSVYFR